MIGEQRIRATTTSLDSTTSDRKSLFTNYNSTAFIAILCDSRLILTTLTALRPSSFVLHPSPSSGWSFVCRSGALPIRTSGPQTAPDTRRLGRPHTHALQTRKGTLETSPCRKTRSRWIGTGDVYPRLFIAPKAWLCTGRASTSVVQSHAPA